jgi:tetratricopeptide (TPR) repeat protein
VNHLKKYLCCIVVVVVACSGNEQQLSSTFPEVTPYPSHEVTSKDFVGAAVCGSCHREQYLQWEQSTHGKAGGMPDKVKVIAKFDGKPLLFKDAVVTPMREGKALFFKVEPLGQPAYSIPVEAVVGGGHMVGGGTQTFFIKAPDGTYRFLPFDFSRHRGEWFVQVRGSNHWKPVSKDIALSDLANWPPHRVLGVIEGYSNCQNCHASQVTVQPSETPGKWVTTFTELAINCESCHGPGRRHVELMGLANRADLEDIGLKPLDTLSKDASLAVCFRCHAIKDALQPGYVDGQPLGDYFSLALPFLPDQQHAPDGRVTGFSYQENHLFSDCYVNGSMTCVDCHAPHDLSYRDNFGKPLQGRFDDGQCTGCHAGYIKAPEHTRHPLNSEGSRCVNCHMPYLQEKGIGNEIPYARSDHTIAIPRPTFDAALGIENACQKCHEEIPVARLAAQVKKWYGEIKPHNKIVRDFVKAISVMDTTYAAELLLQPDANHPIAQTRSIFAYVRRFMDTEMKQPDNAVIEKLKQMAVDNNIELKSFAMMALYLGYGNLPHVHRFLTEQFQQLGEQDYPVRLRMVLALDYLGSNHFLRKDYENAIVCFDKALKLLPNETGVNLNLALTYRKVKQPQKAVTLLEKLAKTNPQDVKVWVGLGEVYIELGNHQKAREAWLQAQKLAPADEQIKQLLRRL